jgi:glycosyltransferase involved in cell wall biosynthesis
MKIQFAITDYFPDVFGGAEVYTQNLAKALAARGHDVSVVSPGIVRRNAVVNEEEVDGIPVHRFAFVPCRIPPTLYAVRFYPELFDEAVEWFRQSRPDIVHVTNSWFISPVVFAAAVCGIPVVGTHVDFVWTCKESHVLKPDGSLCRDWAEQPCAGCFPDLSVDEWSRVQPLRDELHRLLAGCYAFHHCPCPLLAEQIRRLEVVEDRIGTWPYGVPDELLNQRTEKQSSSTLRLAFIGRWNRIKGIDILLDAMELLAARKDIELTLFGEQEIWNRDDYGAAMKRKADALDAVRIGGRIDPSTLGELHRSIDAIVTPSIWPENSPVSILEALALGTPVICADGAGMINLIRHGENGLVFESRNAVSLAEQIVRLADGAKLNASCLGTITEDAARFEKIYAQAGSAVCAPLYEFTERMRVLIEQALRPAD